jgi:hypothetical protein
MHDFRKTPRWHINHKAKIRLEGALYDAHCHIKDINFKGMQVILGLKLIPDKYINMRLILSPGIYMDIQVWVAWHKTIDGRNTYGLYFSKISDADKEKIYKFVYKNVPDKILNNLFNKPLKVNVEQEMQDRRIFQRFNVKLPVKLLDLYTGNELSAEVTDISAKGMGLKLDRQLRINTPVEAWVYCSDQGDPLYTRGVAIWSKLSEGESYRLGVDLERADLVGLSRVLRP